MSAHHCHANDCPTPTAQKLLMCYKHWALVPDGMKKAVLRTYKARSSAPGANPASWGDYYEACANAVEHVARLEGKPETNAYRRTLPNWRKLAAQALHTTENPGPV